MIIQPMHAYSRRSATSDIEESMEGAGVFASESDFTRFIHLPLRTIYPAARPGQPHAYFAEGVKEGLKRLCDKARTRGLGLANNLKLFGIGSTDIGLDPDTVDHAFLLGVEYEGQADPAKPLSLGDFGFHIIAPEARRETPETVRTIA